MADAVEREKNGSGPFEQTTADIPEGVPMARAKGGDGSRPNRSPILIALIIGLVLVVIAVIVGGGGSVVPGAR